ncbi:MAG: LamG domain-containing protein, partial [Haloferacaceae archaeon]
MKRRQLLLGLGSVAGAGSVLGSGAFTSVSADRSVTVNVADDANAFLAMRPCSGGNGGYVTTKNGMMTVDMSPSSPTE